MPLLIVLMWLPFTPPPSKPAQATPPVIVPTDPFDDIQIVTRAPKFKALYFRKMPVPTEPLK